RVKLPATWDMRKIEIKLNGKTVKTEDNILMSGSQYKVTLRGSGTADKFEMIIDNELYYTCSVNFLSDPPKTFNETAYALKEPTTQPADDDIIPNDDPEFPDQGA
ncbi:MAG: hypothetical protein IJU45_01040, partial [Clostridia bacterium]|nr:hypothetical protein [Clostridia bacterium]